MNVPDIRDVAPWLQTRYDMHLFAVDHPGLPDCVGSHQRVACNGRRGKHPLGRWSRDATNDQAAILAALSHGLRNLGIACGPSGLLVVDEDVPGDFARYAATIGQTVPATFTVRTGHGSHFYLRATDPSMGNAEGALSSYGINVRGRGGFVVAPGSVHETGVIYTPVDSSAPILPVPGWLSAALRPPPPLVCKTPGAVTNLPAYAQAALQGEEARVREAVNGQRNSALNKAAYNLGRLVGAGTLPAEVATDALYEAASVHFGPTKNDMTPGEARATIRSGLAAGTRKPRNVKTRGAA